MGNTAGSPVVVGYIETAEGKAALHRAIEEARLRSAPLIVVSSRRDRDAPEHSPDEAHPELDAIRSGLESSGLSVTVDASSAAKTQRTIWLRSLTRWLPTSLSSAFGDEVPSAS